MSKFSRRGLLKLLGLAPIAVAVAAPVLSADLIEASPTAIKFPETSVPSQILLSDDGYYFFTTQSGWVRDHGVTIGEPLSWAWNETLH